MLEVRLAQDEADAMLVFHALKAFYDEGGVPGSFDPVKVLANVLSMVKDRGRCALMAMDGDTLAGVLCLVESGPYWWSTTDRFIEDKGFYVYPQYEAGDAGKLLLETARALSDHRQMPVYISIFNARRKRGARSKWERVGATLDYNPRGAVLAHFPEN
jgi:hypothetical protein